MLVDTSIWIDHLRRGNARLIGLLNRGEVSTHDFVIGELACGSLSRRDHVLGLLDALPRVGATTHEEVLDLVARHRLAGTGIGWMDAHLLASALVAGERIWSADRPLMAAARRLGIDAE